jgi:hypothetical protein
MPKEDYITRLMTSPEFRELLKEVQGNPNVSNAPGYGPSDTLIQCQHCAHAGGANYCLLYNFEFNPVWQCESFQPGDIQQFKMFKPTLNMAEVARKGLALRHKQNYRGKTVGKHISCGRDLVRRKPLTIDAVRKLQRYFQQCEEDPALKTGKGKITWLLRGGDSARRWVNAIIKREGGSKDMSDKVNVVKVAEDQRLVFGFFSINKVGDQLVEDLQGDLIETDTLEKAAYDFVLNARVAGEEHIRKNVGRLVESIMLTYEKQQAIEKCLAAQGIEAIFDLGCEGWFGGFKVDDDEVWAAVKKGDYPAFSIGGSGQRVPLD